MDKKQKGRVGFVGGRISVVGCVGITEPEAMSKGQVLGLRVFLNGN